MNVDELRRSVEERLEREVSALIAGRDKSRSDRPYAIRNGRVGDERWVVVEGRRFKVKVPKLKWVGYPPEGEKRTFYPPHYTFLKREEENDKEIIAVEAILEGVSTRGVMRYISRTGLRESTHGLSSSNVARRFKKASERAVKQVTERRLDHLDLAVVMLDGIEVGGKTVLIAIGYDAEGGRHLLGMAAGASESKDLVVELLGNLERRGAHLSNCLMVTDGGAGLAEGLAEKGYDKAVQRCIRHVQANVRDHMAHKLEFDGVEARIAEAGRGRNRRKGLPRLRKLANELGELGYGEAAKALSDWVEQADRERKNRRGGSMLEHPKLPNEVLEEVREHLPREMWEGFRRPLQKAWMTRDYEKALAGLLEVEARLYEMGERKAAKSLRESMVDTLTVTHLGISSAELRKALLSTNPIESLNSQIRAALRKHTPAWRAALENDEIPMQTRWAAISALRASGSWKQLDGAQELAEVGTLVEALDTLATAAAEIEMRRLDGFDPYVDLLGPRTRKLLADLNPLVKTYAAADPTALEAAVPTTDPFAKLEAVAQRARDREFQHAAARVATAEYMHEHPGRRSVGTALLPKPKQMLELYEREWGAERAAQLAYAAAEIGREFRRDVEAMANGPDSDAAERAAHWAALEVSKNRRLYQYPYPPRDLLEQDLDVWLAENGPEARTAVALELAGREPLSRGAEEVPLNREDMASNSQSSPPQSTAAPAGLSPRHEAQRFVVKFVDKKSVHPSLDQVRSPADGASGWRWIGDKETLGRFGAKQGAQVEAATYLRVAEGLHIADNAKLRTPNTVPDEPAQATQVQGLVQLAGSCQAPDAVYETWREGGPKERETVERWLMSEAQRGIKHLSGTDRFAAAATIREVRGENGETSLRIDWVAIGADRDKGIASAYDRKRMASLERFNKEAGERLVVKIGAEQARLQEQGQEPEQAPSAEVPAPRAPERVAPELPSQPLRDSLTEHFGARPDVVVRLKARADELAKSLSDDLSEAQLRARLPQRDPFKGMPDLSNTTQRHNWWKGKGRDVLRTIAVEQKLIDRASEAYAALARKSARRDPEADPLKEIRAKCGDDYAQKVGRHAAVVASRFGNIPQDPGGKRSQALKEAIDRAGGYGDARFGLVVKQVALENSRNMHSERAFQRQQQIPTKRDRTLGAASEIGAGF